MKRVMILSFAAALIATGCTNKSVTKTPGIDLTNLDTTVACGDDFYEYACGGWMQIGGAAWSALRKVRASQSTVTANGSRG